MTTGRPLGPVRWLALGFIAIGLVALVAGWLDLPRTFEAEAGNTTAVGEPAYAAFVSGPVNGRRWLEPGTIVTVLGALGLCAAALAARPPRPIAAAIAWLQPVALLALVVGLGLLVAGLIEIPRQFASPELFGDDAPTFRFPIKGRELLDIGTALTALGTVTWFAEALGSRRRSAEPAAADLGPVPLNG